VAGCLHFVAVGLVVPGVLWLVRFLWFSRFLRFFWGCPADRYARSIVVHADGDRVQRHARRVLQFLVRRRIGGRRVSRRPVQLRERGHCRLAEP